jgi:membrane protease YdiL (CAAX protease family)
MDGSGSDGVCHNCGTEVYPTDNYCQYCGTTLGTEQTQRSDGTVGNDRVPVNETGQSTPEWDEGEPERKKSGPGAPGSKRGVEPSWRPVAVGLGLAALSIVLLLVFTLLSVPIAVLLQLSTGAALIIGAAIGQYFGFFGLALTYLRHTRNFEWADIREYLGVRFPSLKDLGMVIVGYVGIIGLIIIVSVIISLLQVETASNESANQLTQSAGGDPVLIAGVFALMFLVVGPCEEILYRGVIQNRLRERFSVVPSIVVASIIFGSIHVIALGTTDPIAILATISVLSVTALVLGAVYEYTGNLVVPWLLHSLHNSILVSLAFFGPEAASTAVFAPLSVLMSVL